MILVVGGSGSGTDQTVSLNLTKHQLPDWIKLIYKSKIHSNQSINCLSTEEI